MLVLKRSQGETLLVGDSIRIKVVDVKGGQVRFGIEAPPDVRVVREEIAEHKGGKPPPQG